MSCIIMLSLVARPSIEKWEGLGTKQIHALSNHDGENVVRSAESFRTPLIAIPLITRLRLRETPNTPRERFQTPFW